MAEADAAKRAYQNEVGSRMLKRMGKGPLYGAVRGAIWGATAGTAEFGIGAVPGAAFGASVGAVVGAGGAAIWGGLVVEPLQELGHDYYVDNLMFKIGGNDPVMDCIIEALSAPPAPPVAH
jgi:phage tail tape-measure protein